MYNYRYVHMSIWGNGGYMKLIEKIKNRNDIINQIGRANRKLEINKIVYKFRDFLNNSTLAEKNKISEQLKEIQKERSDLKFYIFLTSLGLVTGGISVFYLTSGDLQYLSMLLMGLSLTGVELRNTVYSSECLGEMNEKFLKYFSANVNVEKDVNMCMGDIKRHQLSGERLDSLNQQLVEDACDEFVDIF